MNSTVCIIHGVYENERYVFISMRIDNEVSQTRDSYLYKVFACIYYSFGRVPVQMPVSQGLQLVRW